jgi:hypothetical protein
MVIEHLKVRVFESLIVNGILEPHASNDCDERHNRFVIGLLTVGCRRSAMF